jgi:DNA invertase Pin-like site-specific DNA recombinase
MATHPASYLRRSYVDSDSPGDISLEAQRAAVAQLAAHDGHNGNLREYSDWGISADHAKAERRTDYARLLADMEAGQVSAVYAFDVDRLYRDPRDLIRLQDAASRHAVRVVTTGGPLPIGDGDDPAAEAFAFIGSIFGRMELQKAKKRARAARDARRARGDRFGHAPYGFLHVHDETGRIIRVPDPDRPVEPVLDVVREAGSILGAVKLLNARGIASPKGRTWHPSALTRVVEHNAPELLPRKGPTGRRQPTRAVLGQLLRCHCGTVLTPNVVRGQYYCNAGKVAGAAKHGKYNVREIDLMPWIEAEADRLTPDIDAVRMGQDMSRRRETLEEDRRRAGVRYAARAMTDDEFAAEVARLDADLASLDDRVAVVEIPAIDWTWEPVAINTVLRALWERVELGDDMRPVRAVWRVPEWRRGPRDS